jgi:hypothetical protein
MESITRGRGGFLFGGGGDKISAQTKVYRNETIRFMQLRADVFFVFLFRPRHTTARTD